MPLELKTTALITMAQLKAWLKIDADDTARDTQLQILGNGASEYCEERIGERFKPRDYTVTRNGDGRTKILRLPRPILSVASLTLDGQAVDPSEYVVDAENGKIELRCRTTPCGVGNVVVTLNAGYADEDLPGQLIAACLDLAKSHFEEWDNGAISLSSINIGPASTVIKPGLNPRIEKYLDTLRDVRG